jgi:hypothetical protein
MYIPVSSLASWPSVVSGNTSVPPAYEGAYGGRGSWKASGSGEGI